MTRLVCLSCLWIAAITDLRGELPSFPKDSIPLVFSLKKAVWAKSLSPLIRQKLVSSQAFRFVQRYVFEIWTCLALPFFTVAPLALKPP